MGRMIQDDDFRTWEAFATTGDYGFPRPARIVFRCRDDPAERSRVVTIEGDKSDAEARLRSLEDGELEEMLADAPVLD